MVEQSSQIDEPLVTLGVDAVVGFRVVGWRVELIEQRGPGLKTLRAETTLPLPECIIELSDVGENVVNVEALNLASKSFAVRVFIFATSSLKVVKSATCGDEFFIAVLAFNIGATVDPGMEVL